MEGKLNVNVGLRRRLRIGTDEHPLYADVPRETLSPVRDTLSIPPLEIRDGAETVTGLFSPFQAVTARDSSHASVPSWIGYDGLVYSIPGHHRGQDAKLLLQKILKSRVI